MLEHLINSQEHTSTSHLNSFIEEAEYIQLPSKGYFYSNFNKKIKIRKLNWLDENLLTTKSFYDQNILIEELLKQVIVDEDFIIEELIPIDIVTILIWLKLSTFGKEHTIPMKCKNKIDGKECGSSISVTWDLSNFDMPDFPNEYEKELSETGGVNILVNFNEYNIVPPSLKKINEVKNFIYKNNLQNINNTEKLLNIIKFIKDKNNIIEGIENIYNYLLKNKFSIQDSRNLLKESERINLKINSKNEIICPNCSKLHTISLTVDQGFFGLNSRKYKEYLIKSQNFLVFWGKIDYQSILTMPTYKRKMMIELTHDNLKTLYGSKK